MGSRKEIGKRAEREAKKRLSKEGLVVYGETTSYYENSTKNKGVIDLILIKDGEGYQIKTTQNKKYYFKKDEVLKIIDWTKTTGFDAYYLILFRRGQGKKGKWYKVRVSKDLIGKKVVLEEDEVVMEILRNYNEYIK